MPQPRARSFLATCTNCCFQRRNTCPTQRARQVPRRRKQATRSEIRSGQIGQHPQALSTPLSVHFGQYPPAPPAPLLNPLKTDTGNALRRPPTPSRSRPHQGRPKIVSTMPTSTPSTAGSLRRPLVSPKSHRPPANATNVLPRRRLDTSETSDSGFRSAPK